MVMATTRDKDEITAAVKAAYKAVKGERNVLCLMDVNETFWFWARVQLPSWSVEDCTLVLERVKRVWLRARGLL